MQATRAAARPRSKTALARRAWQLMFDYLIWTSPLRERSLERRGLTPNDARALWDLDARQGRPIGSLSREWKCDPANATFIIGRLERAGLARRQESDRDRRVKLVTLTRKGATTKQQLLREYHAPPPGLKALAPAELSTLIAVMTKLQAAVVTRSPDAVSNATRQRSNVGISSEMKTR